MIAKLLKSICLKRTLSSSEIVTLKPFILSLIKFSLLELIVLRSKITSYKKQILLNFNNNMIKLEFSFFNKIIIYIGREYNIPSFNKFVRLFNIS